MELVSSARIASVLIPLVFLGYLILKTNQSSKLNWAMFFAGLWVTLTLTVVNLLCVDYELWSFTDDNILADIPIDIYFSWVVCWSFVPVFLLKGKYILISSLLIFWIDLLVMPALESYGILTLNEHWIIGEIALVLLVFIPAQLWAHLFINDKSLVGRSALQVICIALLYIAIFPLLVVMYYPDLIAINQSVSPYLIQFVFIIALPALIAVMDLVVKGKGTPFPYDPTKRLVQSGVYAYCRNPIQVTLTLLFIPLAWYHDSWVLLSGIIISLAYAFAVAYPQENKSMELRFPTQWNEYKNKVPTWGFLWRPVGAPHGSIYFKSNCGICQQTRTWVQEKKPIHLDFLSAELWPGEPLRELTYVDEFGNRYGSVLAMAHTFNHINLVWASLGWFMRLPGIHHLLQAIVDAIGLREFR